MDQLVYWESFQEIGDAIMREKQIKGGSRQKKLDLINGLNPKWNDLYENIKEIMNPFHWVCIEIAFRRDGQAYGRSSLLAMTVGGHCEVAAKFLQSAMPLQAAEADSMDCHYTYDIYVEIASSVVPPSSQWR